MKKKSAKFVQIISHAGDLHALDANGVVWRLAISPNLDAIWRRKVEKREK